MNLRCKKHIWNPFGEDTNFDICVFCGKKRKTLNLDWRTGKIWKKTRVINFSDFSRIDKETGEKVEFEPSDKGKSTKEILENISVKLFLDRLSPAEKIVVELRMEEVSFKEIGIIIGKTEERVRKIKQGAKEKMGKWL